MADQGVTINIRTRGGRQSAREAKMAASGITLIGRAATTAGKGLRSMSSDASHLAYRSLRGVRYQAYFAGLTLSGIGAIAVKSGLQFNASMEQNQVAFAQFLGSSQAARQELTTLYGLAKSTPFEFPQLTMAARQLLGFGFKAREANSLLRTIGDAAAATGQGAEGIDRIVIALGQMRAKGRVQAEELMQLQELGLPVNDILRKRLHLTRDQLANIGNESVSSTKAIRALQQGFDDLYGGQSAKQAKTFNGQLSTLRDNVNQTLGTISKPAFDKLRTDVFPVLNDTASRLNDIFGRKDLDLAQKITLSKAAVRHRLGPFVDELGDEIGKLNLGARLGDAIDAGIPRIADAAGRAAPKIAGAFVNAWLHSGPWGKLITTAFFAKKLGVFSAIGSLAAWRFKVAWGKRIGTLSAPVQTPTIVPGGGPSGKGGKLGKLGRGLGAVAGAGQLFLAGKGVIDLLSDGSLKDRLRRAIPNALGPELGGLVGDFVLGNEVETIQHVRLPTLHFPKKERPRARAAAPSRHVINVYVDGKPVAHVLSTNPNYQRALAQGVKRAASDAKARR